MTVRICERQDAERMLRDGTLAGFLQMWADRYPPDGKIRQVKEYRDAFGCTLREAKEAVNRCCRVRQVDLDFEIGDEFVLRRRSFRWTLLFRVEGIMTQIGEYRSADQAAADIPLAGFVGFRSICSRPELVKAGRKGGLVKMARSVLYELNRSEGPFLFCGEEIWRKEGRSLHMDRRSGCEETELTTEAVRAQLQKHYERLDPARDPF